MYIITGSPLLYSNQIVVSVTSAVNWRRPLRKQVARSGETLLGMGPNRSWPLRQKNMRWSMKMWNRLLWLYSTNIDISESNCRDFTSQFVDILIASEIASDISYLYNVNIIMPLFKKVDTKMCSNYRGNTLSSVYVKFSLIYND